MLGFRSSSASQLSAAKDVLRHVADEIDVPVNIRLWDDSITHLSPRAVGSPLTIVLRSPGVIGKLLRWPTLDHFVRQYATGGIDFEGGSPLEFGDALRATAKKPKLRHLNKPLLLRSALPFLFANADSGHARHGFEGECENVAASQRRDKDYIQFHYDVGNEFYELFLGQEMVYSCGYFTNEANTLDQAQHDKLDMICRKLRLQPGEKFLDIGCGWGGLICHAAKHYGVQAHGVTLAERQLEYVQAKVARLGLQGRVTAELKDYRDLEGKWDKIASIGMFEHVGVANMPQYFAKLNSLLRDRGILLNHGISNRAKPPGIARKRMRPERKLFAKYIFPGGELDNIGHSLQCLEATGFSVHDVEGWREHYMHTTAHWCRNLYANREEAIRQVGPERYRLWIGYLAGVSFAFQDGSMHIFQTVASKHAKRGISPLPLTREDLYEQRPCQSARRAA